MGLPGESADDIIAQAKNICNISRHSEIHQLQVVRGTRLAEDYERKPFHVFSVDEYIRTISEYIRNLRPSIVIERFVSQSPKGMLLAPDWGLKNYEFTDKLNKYLRENDIRQGDAL